MSSIFAKIREFGGNVKVPVTIKRDYDYASAWSKMEIDPEDGKKIIKDLELVWHHVDDMDVNFNSTIQLVTEDAHFLTLTHTGGHKELKELFNIINDLP